VDALDSNSIGCFDEAEMGADAVVVVVKGRKG
jgi:hypothetical protein